MGRHNRKRSYSEHQKDQGDGTYSSIVGVGAALADLRDAHQRNGVECPGASFEDSDNAHRPSDEWHVVNRHSKKRRRSHQKHTVKTLPEQAAASKKDNRPALTYTQLHQMQSSLKISDLQGLALYCLADGTSPQWISVRHHNHIKKVVVLLVPGLEREMFNGHIELLDSASTVEIDASSTNLNVANDHTPAEPLSLKPPDLSHAGHGRSPDEYLPIPLEMDKLPAPLKPLAHVFDHLWPVKAPGDDKYTKVHSPLHAMLAAPIPKSREQKAEQEKPKGSKPFREVSEWKSDRTPISHFVLSSEDLRENEFPIHPASLATDEEKELNFQRRKMAKQLESDGWMDTIVANLSEADVPHSEVESGSLTVGRTVLAIDCEMCLVEGGESALTRISIVDWAGEVILDELVMPDRPITDYLTQYSGMTAAKLATVSAKLTDIQTRLLGLLTPRTILIGHSLNSDLAALKITHPFVIDTSVLYPHPRGHPLKSSLKYLAQKYLGREIQRNHGATGHDSIEDASACLDLVKQKCEKGPKWGTVEASNEPIYKRLSRSSRPGTAGMSRTGAIVDHAASVRNFNGVADVCIQCENDGDVVSGVKRAVLGDEDGAVVPGGGVDFTWARLHELSALRGWTNHAGQRMISSVASSLPSAEPSASALSNAVSQTVHNILSIHAALPPCTLFIVYSGTGDRRDMARLEEMQWQFKREYATKKWDELSIRWTDNEEQALRRACAPLSVRRNIPVYGSLFQRRFASDEVTQAEPEADGATEAQHGENSIASSTKDLIEPESEESSATDRAVESAALEEQENSTPAQDEQLNTTTSHETSEWADQEERGDITSTAESISARASQVASSFAGATDAARQQVANAASAVGASDEVASAVAGREWPRSSKPDSPNSLYIGNLYFDVTEEALKKEMERFGAVEKIKIVYDGRGLSKGFGYVDYVDSASAVKAIENLNQQVFEGRRLNVQYTIRKENVPRPIGGRNPPTKTLFIGNMSFEMTDRDLNDLFRDIKNVIDVRVAIDRRTGQPRGFAHADFIDTASASKAFEILEAKEIYGRKLRVDYSVSTLVEVFSYGIAMAFLGGAECSTAGNPLTQFTKHVQDDKSLQRDRLMMDEFLQKSGGLPQGPMQPFAMEQMRREIESYPANASRTGSPGWAAEYDPGEHARMEVAFQSPISGGFVPPGFSPAEFQRFQQMERNAPARATNPQSHTQGSMNGYQRPMNLGYGMNMGMMGNSYRPMSMQRTSDIAMLGNGKGKVVELDDKNWEQEFAEIAAEGQRNLDGEASAAMEVELNDIDRSVLSTNMEMGDFEGVWRSIQAEKAANRQMEDTTDFDAMLADDYDPWGGFDTLNSHGAFRDPQLGGYLFEEENVFQAVGDPFSEGVRIMEEGGNLSLAALAFEAAVQKDPSHVIAWNMLGSAQAQNEKEAPAIRALEQALKLDPSNLEALMGLAVSYTNEGYDATAYRTLERWLSVKYPQIVSPDDLSKAADVGFTDRHQLHEKVTNQFIRAAQLSPHGEHMDPDVQVGLGVLFYGDEEYEKAVDCFSAALASTESGSTNQRRQVHLLWNRLGATLANSGRSEEAIAAYEKALTLNPNFVRARYNLGVSCINIGCYEEAAQHLLGALSMHRVVEREGRERVQQVVGGAVDDGQLERMMSMNQSTNLYETLRRVFGQMDRRDLARLVVPGMDVEAFRGEFDF